MVHSGTAETMTTKLHISPDLALPVDAATQTFAFIARKGAGKTYAAGKFVECLLDAHVQVIILDTVGNWYGLRLLADGKSAGYDIAVLGGLRGDIPLEAASGPLIADIAIESGRSLIIDISQFSLADRKRFAYGFGERLWLAKKRERRPTPVHLVIEESQLIVPQFTGKGEGDTAKMLGVYEEIIRLGRNYWHRRFDDFPATAISEQGSLESNRMLVCWTGQRTSGTRRAEEMDHASRHGFELDERIAIAGDRHVLYLVAAMAEDSGKGPRRHKENVRRERNAKSRRLTNSPRAQTA
jgi:hypothetical protein